MEVFLLSEEAIKEMLQGCQKGTDACAYDSAYARTICHHHYSVCGENVPLAYNTLHLKIVLKDPESALFAPIMQANLHTKEAARLRGFGDMVLPQGTIQRDWKWMTREEAVQMGVTGLKPRNTMRLSWAMQRVDGLLLGIECSAPLKEDCFGNAHGVDAKSKEVSAFGKRKWRDYRGEDEDVPANLGGVVVNIDIAKFKKLHLLCEGIGLCMPSDGNLTGLDGEKQARERQLFQDLLQSPDSEFDTLLHDFMADQPGGEAYASC